MSTTKYPFDLQRALDGEPVVAPDGYSLKFFRMDPPAKNDEEFWVEVTGPEGPPSMLRGDKDWVAHCKTIFMLNPPPTKEPVVTIEKQRSRCGQYVETWEHTVYDPDFLKSPSVIRSDKSQELEVPQRSQFSEAIAGAMAEFRRLLSVPKAESGYDLKARLDELSANLKEI